MDRKKLLVLGVGNILMKDEGIGVHAIHRFWEEKAGYDKNLVDFVDGGTFTQDLFFLFESYENILVLDVVRAGRAPGTIYSLDEEDLAKDANQVLSLHDVDLLDSLNMARMRGAAPKLKIVGIEPDTIDWGLEMTHTLSRAFPSFLHVARKHVRGLLN